MQNNKLLLLFFLVVIFKQLVWISLIPIWQTPDEQAHFAQIQNIAENNYPAKYSSSKEIEASEKLLGVLRDLGGNNRYTYHPDFNIPYTKTYIGKYEKQINNINKKDRKILIINEATGYPPMYYQFGAFGYRLTNNLGLIDRVFFMRIWQNILYILTIFVYFKIMQEIIIDKKKQILFLSFIAFMPMPSFVAVGITSDNLMNLIFPMGVYLGLLILKYGIRLKLVIVFILLGFVGLFTKPHYIIILPIVIFAEILRNIYDKHVFRIPKILSICLFGGLFYYRNKIMQYFENREVPAIIPEINYDAIGKLNNNVNIWQYLLISIKHTYYEVIPWFWGIFRWLSLSLDRWFYRTMNIIVLISLISFLVYFFKVRKAKKNITMFLFIYLLSVVVCYFLALFFWDYLFFISHNYWFGIQGRYYFPVLFPIAMIIYYFFPFLIKNVFNDGMKEKATLIISTILSVFMIFINSYAILKLSFSYYDSSSLNSFLIQASQYKPWYFKGSYLMALFLFYLLILSIFLIKLLQHEKED